MCGIIGSLFTNKKSVALEIYEGLNLIQHRGQDSAGIATGDNKKVYIHKNTGLVQNIFKAKHISYLKGSMGIGHVRYPTQGTYSIAESQPFYINYPYGISLAHNGNLVNSDRLKNFVKKSFRHINTDSDTEMLVNVFGSIMAITLSEYRKIKTEDIFYTVKKLHKIVSGAYSVVAMLSGFGIIGFRDPNGIRPLILGKKKVGDGDECFMFSSESVSLTALGYSIVKDVQPGECIVVTVCGQVVSKQCSNSFRLSPCIFEYVYFARPDSIIDGISVYKARMRMGEFLANKIRREIPIDDIDSVIPIPETSRNSALALANELGIKYREGFVKNRYIARTFIMPEKKCRSQSIKRKLSPIGLEFKGKNVLLVDDSIVRGNTSAQIIQLARDYGANKVYFASASPLISYPNIYGIDMHSAKEFIAYESSVEQIREKIRADKLVFQDLEDLVQAVKHDKNVKVESFDISCFNGKYLTGDKEAKKYIDKGVKKRDREKIKIRLDDV